MSLESRMKREYKKIKNFTDLTTWQVGHRLVLEIYKITKQFPNAEKFELTSQIQRAAMSITSNVAEGFSRKSNKEKIQFYYLSLGSLTELQNQLLIAKDLGYLSTPKFNGVAELTVTVAKLLNGLISSTKRSRNLDSKLKAQNSKAVLSVLFLFCTLISLSFLLSPFHAHAQDRVSQSFGVDPLKIVEDVSAENSVEVPIKVYNLKSVEMDYLLSVERFEVKDNYGNLVFTELETIDTQKEPQILLTESQITIPANSSKTVIANISTDKRVPPKEFYYTIFITPVPISNGIGTNVTSVQGKIGVLTFVNVVKPGKILGELIKRGSIVEFNAPAIDFRSPLQFSAIINNTSTVHYDADGTIKIYNSNDQLVKTISLRKATILPGATRILESSGGEKILWNFGLKFGKYKCVLNIKSVDGTLNKEKSIEFFILPIMPLFILAIIILSVTILVIIRRRQKSLTAEIKP